MTVYGYARCSTNEEKQDITRQIRDLEGLGVARENIYTEYVSGTKRERIELNRMLEKVTEGDTVITTEVSRISRSMKDLLEILDIFKDKKVKVVLGSFVLDFSKGDTDPMVMAMIQMLGVFSEMERNIISQRVKSGMENAKARGSKMGRETGSILKLDEKFKYYYKQHLENPKQMTKSEISRILGLSRVTINKYESLIKENPDQYPDLIKKQ